MPATCLGHGQRGKPVSKLSWSDHSSLSVWRDLSKITFRGETWVRLRALTALTEDWVPSTHDVAHNHVQRMQHSLLCRADTMQSW